MRLLLDYVSSFQIIIWLHVFKIGLSFDFVEDISWDEIWDGYFLFAVLTISLSDWIKYEQMLKKIQTNIEENMYKYWQMWANIGKYQQDMWYVILAICSSKWTLPRSILEANIKAIKLKEQIQAK